MMRHHGPLLPALAAAAALACGAPPSLRAMPQGQLYFPTGMFFARPAGAPERSGALFVASSNFDRRYGTGRLSGIDVSALACGVAPAGACVPDFPAPRAAVIDIVSLGGPVEKGLASLAGEMDGIEDPAVPGTFRLVIPSRAEGSPLQIADATGAEIACAGDPSAEDCSAAAFSLEANRLVGAGVPRAPAPFSASIYKGPDVPNTTGTGPPFLVETGDTFVTSLQVADSPAASGQGFRAYAVSLNVLDDEVVSDDSFLQLGLSPTESVAMGQRYAFMSGPQSVALRMVDHWSESPRVINSTVEGQFNLLDTRGLALAPDESQLFLVVRRPDALLALRVRGGLGDFPSLGVIHAQLLPLGASQVRVVDKPSGGHVAFISCVGTQSYDAVGSSQGALVVWDDASAKVVSLLDGFGFQPYGLAIQTIGGGARVYIGLFGEGRIAVVDVPDLDAPDDVRLVARLGTSHVCTVNPSALGCTETTP